MARRFAFLALAACGGSPPARPTTPPPSAPVVSQPTTTDTGNPPPPPAAASDLSARGDAIRCDNVSTADFSIDGLLDDWKQSPIVARIGAAPDGAITVRCAWDGSHVSDGCAYALTTYCCTVSLSSPIFAGGKLRGKPRGKPEIGCCRILSHRIGHTIPVRCMINNRNILDNMYPVKSRAVRRCFCGKVVFKWLRTKGSGVRIAPGAPVFQWVRSEMI